MKQKDHKKRGKKEKKESPTQSKEDQEMKNVKCEFCNSEMPVDSISVNYQYISSLTF